MKRRLSLRRRLQLLAALAILPAFLIVALNLLSARSLRLEELDDYALRMSEILQHEVIRGLTGAAVLLVAAGQAPVVASASEECASYLGSFARELPTVVDIAAADVTGQIYCSAGESNPDELERIANSLMPTADRMQIAVGTFVRTPRGAAIPIGAAIRDDSGSVQRYVIITVALTELERLVAERGDLPGSRAIVADVNGTVLLRYPSTSDLKAGDPLPADYRPFAVTDSPGTTWLGGDGSSRHIVGYQPLRDLVPISFVFEIPADRVMAPINRATLMNTLVALAGAAVALVLATWYGRKFIQVPVDHLLTVLDSRRGGDRDARIRQGGLASEFDKIGRSVDALFDELDRNEDEQRRLQQQRDLFARELQHRVKNLLAIIQVIAKQTLSRRSAAPEVHAFEQRILALIKANSTLLADKGKGGDLLDIVAASVGPFGDGVTGRISIEGPHVKLGAKAGIAVTLALHELATNAAKYGALSVDEGRIAISWSVDDRNLDLSWTEAGGPEANAPAPPGFGTMMIKRVLEAETRGQVDMAFERDGFRFRLVAPLQALSPGEDVASPARPSRRGFHFSR